MMRYPGMRSLLASTAVICAVAAAAPASAQTKSFNVPAQPAITGIPELARQADVQILVSESATRGKTTRAVKGSMSVEQALRQLLKGTGLIVSSSDGRTFTLAPRESGLSATGSSSVAEGDIVVTGTRLKGAPSVSPVIEVTEADMRAAGQNTIADVFQSLPQNFSGGQNPAVLIGATNSNAANNNTTGASSLNLRGLGPDATLTLLNGRRLAYNSSVQAVDVSVIPAAALDRIEIVADGSSAIYGSDAVAGVANIILKKDYSGLSTSARWGQSTDGGDAQQQYSAVGGTKWSTGGVIATFDYQKGTAINSNQRSYTTALKQPYMLLPPSDRYSFVLSGHQDIGDFATFSLDAIYGRNKSNSVYTNVTTSEQKLNDEEYNISPQLVFHLPSDWSVSVSGVYGDDIAHRDALVINPATGNVTSSTIYRYFNTVASAELNAEGPLFELPGGSVRAVVGGGYRETEYHYDSSAAHRQGNQSSKFGYVEAIFPFLSDAQDVPLIRKLTLTSAVRYESYKDLGDIFTPKLGLIYEPIGGVQIKSSWGRSFKAPTLSQQSTPTYTYLYDAADTGGSGYPAAATVLYTVGGNPDLKPERAETWTATLDLTPSFAKGLHASISYFDTTYKNRIVSPITTILFLSTPSYTDFVTYNPSLDLQNATISAAPDGLVNAASSDYNPANVVAVVDNRYINAARQRINGVDFSIEYNIKVGNGEVLLAENASYLHGTQRNYALSSEFPISGVSDYPASWRSRSQISWKSGNYQISTYANYVSGITDNTLTPAFSTNSMTTFDIVGVYSTGNAAGIFKNIDVNAYVLNVFNASPPYLYRISSYVANYDSTNYSAVGRFIGFGITKKW